MKLFSHLSSTDLLDVSFPVVVSPASEESIACLALNVSLLVRHYGSIVERIAYRVSTGNR
jgi:hypothetical protein